MNISGNIVDVVAGVIYPGTLEVRDGIIINIVKETKSYDTYIIPGFVDSHIHVESSMLAPSEFARLAVIHGTVAALCDPHEIANVLGIEGVRYMIENGKTTPFKFYFGASPCVPATPYETSGATIGVKEIEALFRDYNIGHLAEVMNFPGVINEDPELMAKIALAHTYGKRIDGHAPGLSGDALKRYIAAGITTDHEIIEKKGALEKIALGMKVQIREGSAAKNFETLYGLIEEYPDFCMFCGDDKHPDDLIKEYIDMLAKRAVGKGIDVMKVLQCACLNPVSHYGLDVGLLQKYQRADFLVVNNLTDFRVLKTFINGELVAEDGKTYLAHRAGVTPNRFQATRKTAQAFRMQKKGERIRVIEAIEGQLLTGSISAIPRTDNDNVVSDPERDILKMAVINRYENKPPAIGFVKNFGLKKGAIASSVAHDSHNIIAVGISDEAICAAVNLVIEHKGGISLISDEFREVLPLPIAGIMSSDDGFAVAEQYARLNSLARGLGAKLTTPYMSLSFMALLVIPKLKLSDKSLFDGESFTFVDLFI
jgi:adenine deaminase